VPIYSDVIARLDDKSVADALKRLESEFETGGTNLGATFTRAFSAAGSNFSAGLSAGLKQTIGEMGALDSSAESALGGMALKAAGAAAGVGLIATAAVKAAEALYDVGAQFDAVSDRIAVRTNSLGDDMDNLNNSLREAFRNSSSSLEEVGDVLGRVSQSLHLTGQPLSDVTTQIADLNRMTGENLNIREYGQVLAQFGDGAGSAANALDMLYAASAKSGIPLNELLTNLRNAGPAAQTLGLNLGELTNLLTKFEDGGILASRAQMALNNAAKVFADSGIPLQTGLADTITQLRGFIDAGNEAAAVDLAGKVFGERGAQQFVQLIRDGKLTVEDLNTELGNTGDAIEKQNQNTRDWREEWDHLKNSTKDLADNIGGPLYDALNAVATKALEFANNMMGANGVPGQIGSAVYPWMTQDGITTPGGDAPYNTKRDQPGHPYNPPGGTGQDIAAALEAAKAGGGAPGAPQIPYPAGYGQPPAPGESMEQWQRRMQIMDAQHDVAEKQAALTQLEAGGTADQNAVVKARNDLIQANMRAWQVENQQAQAQQAQQAQVPYPAGYGAPPRPGETAQQYGAEQAVYAAQQKHAEARARLAQVEQTATATAEDLTAARNNLAKAEVDEHQAQLRLAESAGKANDQLGEVGAKLDADFGVSKGLAGIVDNVTRMLAGFAAAPIVGALSGAQAGLGYKPGEAGSGLMGILASSGVFGDQYVKSTAGAISIPPYNPAITLPAPSSAASSPGATYSAGAAMPGESARAYAHRVMMPYWQSQGLTVGDHAADQYGEHQNGALDVMVPNLSTGSRVLQQALSDPNVYGAIFNNQTYGYGHGATPKPYGGGNTGDPTQDHQDHVHIWYKPGATGNINPSGLPGMGGSGLAGGAGGATPVFVVNMPGGGGFGGDFGLADASPSSLPSAGGAGARPGGVSVGGGAAPGAGIAAGLFPGLFGASTPGLSPGLLGVPGASTPGSSGGGGASASAFFPGLGGPPQSLPGLGFPAAGGGPGAGPTLLGGLAPPEGTGGGFSGMSGGILGAALGAASSGAGLAATAAAGGMDGGAGGAAASAAMQIGIQLLNRTVQQAGQVTGIAAQGLMETFLPFGASELAQNNWLTKIIGGITGARPVMPNIAGGSGKKTPEGLTPEQAAQWEQGQGPTPEDVAGKPPGAQQAGTDGQGKTINNNVTVNNQRPTEDGTGRDVTYHLGQMYSGPGQ
jgi:hypothetical protein